MLSIILGFVFFCLVVWLFGVFLRWLRVDSFR